MAITSCFPNVFMVSQAVNVVYAGWPRVQADLNCMADLYNASTKWKYFINLCGQDFPLKTNLEIVRMLRLLRGGNSMESEKMPPQKQWRVSLAHQIVDGSIQVLPFLLLVEFLHCHIVNLLFKLTLVYFTIIVSICLRVQDGIRSHLHSTCPFCQEMLTSWLIEVTFAACWRTHEYRH